MNTLDFVKKFIFENPIEEVSCPIDNGKCKLYLSPTSVLVRNNDIFIIGDNRKDEKNKNKVILIKNVNLENNTFDLSYMECIPTEKFYLYLFTNNINPTSYSYGLSISLSSTGTNLTGALFNDYNILEGYSHPPIITLDNGNLSFKLKENSTNNIKYIHHIINFDVIVEGKIKFEKRANIDTNKEKYKEYFTNQIKSYQEYFKKITAEQEEDKVKSSNSIFLQKYKYYLIGGGILLLLIIILIIILIVKRKKGDDSDRSSSKKKKSRTRKTKTSEE